jgi:hypothetical protein
VLPVCNRRTRTHRVARKERAGNAGTTFDMGRISRLLVTIIKKTNYIKATKNGDDRDVLLNGNERVLMPFGPLTLLFNSHVREVRRAHNGHPFRSNILCAAESISFIFQ